MIIFQVVPSKLKPQKQPSIGVLIKRYSENMQPIVRRTPMLKCEFKKLRKQLYWNHTSAVVISSKFAHNFRIHFLKNTCGGLLLKPLNCFIFLIIIDKISTKYQYRFKVKGNPKEKLSISQSRWRENMSTGMIFLLEFLHSIFISIIYLEQINTQEWPQRKNLE